MARKNSVGYGRPPRHSRFRKGHSGNPSGRPKHRKTLVQELLEELAATVTIDDNGRAAQVPRQTAIARAVVAKAMAGDLRAASLVFAHCVALADDPGDGPTSDADGGAHADGPESPEESHDDAKQVAEFLNARLKQLPPPSSTEGEGE
jgi:hypothetical protein